MSPAVPVERTSIRLCPDTSRVVTQPFVPGEELLAEGESRAEVVMERILTMPEDQVASTLERTLRSFSGRHRDLPAVWRASFELVAHRLGERGRISDERRLLMGAYFTHEFSIEAAALFNPSMVPAPDDGGETSDRRPFILTLRAVGEGHRSSVEFRTGSVERDGEVTIDPPGPFPRTGIPLPATYDKALFAGQLGELGHDNEASAFVLDAVPDPFVLDDLDRAIAAFHHRHLAGTVAHDTIRAIHALASANYAVTFPAETQLSERVLVPMSAAESHGVEDARFVRFTDDGGEVRYYGTYTAFDGTQVRPQLIETADFTTFHISTLNGRFAQNKGMAIFPRRVGGRYVCLSRWDRENTTIAVSDDVRRWDEASLLQCPEQPWELIQIGNCGSPMETSEGWLVLTHGVGPMRQYSIGALLLDLEEPGHVQGKLRDPLMVPTEEEREGYVPNVLYSCGAMLHGDRVVLPYGFADWGVSVAIVALDDLLAAMT